MGRIDRDCKKRNHRRKNVKRKFQFLFKKYFPRYSEILSYFNLLSAIYGDLVRTETIGRSYEGREIKMIVISKCQEGNKYAAFIDANIHAREWLSNSTVLYFIDHILRFKHILNYMDFYIVPCVNPDGFEYCHTKNRLWRKNRNPNNTKCLEMQGVDLNRNFPFAYGLEGSSDDLKSFMYRGAHALSEPESRALANALKKYKTKIKLYISLHAYGNVIIFPYGYTKEEVSNRLILEKCGFAAKYAMIKAGECRNWKVGSMSELMYLSSGTSVDYAYGDLDIKFAYTIELQHFGKSGFTPPPSKIVKIGKETTAGILTMVKFVYKYYESDSRTKNVGP